MLFLGTLITAASGRLNGSVFSRNRGGPYIRSWVMPDETPTTERQAVWDAMAACAARWATLSQEQQLDWESYSLSHHRVNRIGVPRAVGAFPEFTRANFITQQANNLLLTSFAFKDDAPADTLEHPQTQPTYYITNEGTDPPDWYLNVEIPANSNYEDSAEAGLALYVSDPQSPNRNSWPGPFTLAHVVTPPGSTLTSSFSIPSAAVAGQTLFTRSTYFDSQGHVWNRQRSRLIFP